MAWPAKMDDFISQVVRWLQSDSSSEKAVAEENILKSLKEVIGSDQQLELADSIAANPKLVGPLFSFASCILEGKIQCM